MAKIIAEARSSGDYVTDPQRLAREYGEDGGWLIAELQQWNADYEGGEALTRDVYDFLMRGGRLATELRALRADPIALELLVKLSLHSRFGMEQAVQYARLFWDVVQDRQYRQVWGRTLLREDLQRQLAPLVDPKNRINALIRFRNYHHLRIMLGDIHGTMSFEGITSELSDVTDVLVDAALEMAYQKYYPRFGKPQCGMVVLGMGKLGGRELNYSSDIDLIFFYRCRGETAGGPKAIDHHDFFRRVGTEVIAILDQHHSTGRLFRVDMRLRPHGASGELVHSYDEAMSYYYDVGRAWERQAMIKARPIAGELPLGEQLLEELRPWIYPKELAVDELQDARIMRRRIEERATDSNVKTGAGGIRDIEFLVQFFQLGYGGRNPDLRHRATLPALRMLADVGLLSAEDELTLEHDYIWLRMVEHRLQMYEGRQLHDVPDDDEQRRLLARRCGYSGVQALMYFDRDLETVRHRVRSLAEAHYLTVSAEEDAFRALILSDELDEHLARRVLAGYGFLQPVEAARRLRGMAAEPFFILRRDRTQRALIELLPELMLRLAEAPDIDEALANLQKIVDAVGGRSEFYVTLAERRDLLDTVINLSGWATLAVSELSRFPGLPDDLGQRLVGDTLSAPSDLEREAQDLCAGISDPVPALGYFKARETVAAAVADLNQASPWQVWSYLTRVACAVLDGVVNAVTTDLAERWGSPVLDDESPCRFAVLGCGKLGGGELSYASDMDVIFVCDAGGQCLDGKHDGDAFWTRVAKTLARRCQEGRLYEIDPRLRPWGDQGQLVVTLDALRDYWSKDRDLWERLAMLRVSPVAGDPELGAMACSVVREAAITAPLPDDAAHQVRDMRQRLEESVRDRDHIKRGWGGYNDVEFATFYKCLGCDPLAFPVGASVAQLLESLQRIEKIPRDAALACGESLRFLRRMEARMRLMDGKAISSLPTDPQARQRFARCAGFVDTPRMDLRLHMAREQARTWFNQLVV